MDTLIRIISQNTSKSKNIDRLFAKCQNNISHLGLIVEVDGCKKCKSLVCGSCIVKKRFYCILCKMGKENITKQTFICYLCGSLLSSFKVFETNKITSEISNIHYCKLCEKCRKKLLN